MIDADPAVSIEGVVTDCERMKAATDTAMCGLLDFDNGAYGVLLTGTAFLRATDGDRTAGLRTERRRRHERST